MTLALTPRDRRTLASGVLSVGSILLLGKGFPAVRTWESARVTAAAQLRGELVTAERNDAMLPFVRDSAAERVRRLETQRARLIRGASADAAAAALGTLVEGIALDEGVDVLTMTLRPDSVIRLGMARVTVRFGAEGDVDGLMNLLAAFESHASPIAVRELSVSQAEPMAPPNRVETLRFDVTVETLARIGAASFKDGGKAR